MSAFRDAYVRYFAQFPTLESLGVNAVAWGAELNAVQPGAFDPVTWTAVTLEGGNASGRSNFAQMELVRALHAIRALRDPTYVNPYTLDIPEPMAGKRIGFVVQLGH